MRLLSQILGAIQGFLFPFLEDELGPLTDKVKQVVQILELIRIEDDIEGSSHRRGRKPESRKRMARAFVAKSVYNLSTTLLLIDQLKNCPSLRRNCGYETISQIPSESTFSRAFDEFSQTALAERVHEALIEKYQQNRLIGHISRVSTAIEGNEKPMQSALEKPKAKWKRGRPKKGEEEGAQPSGTSERHDAGRDVGGSAESQ